ncbi:Craniofacial development protein 2 [Zea mays]|uniref:Craniofacial development protein 2 n=1 Tax=Zea mays TaxID=4577 RepID=A0A3L6EML1_MAIZE|nr:Craniofacial development protein 2 [Zea mays]
MVRAVPTNEKLFIGGDLNGHVGSTNAGYELAHGSFGYGSSNQEGEDILDFVVVYNLVIANTFFRKRDSHLVTFSSGHRSSQIDFVLTRREDKQVCLDCKVIPRESVVPQHNLVLADFRFRIHTHRDQQAKITRTKWWKLKGETSEVFRERVFVEGAWSEEKDANNMWVKMATCIRKVASEVFGVTKGSRGEPKDTWWWTEDVQKSIKEKKECYRSSFHDRSAINIERYKVAKKTAKGTVSGAKGRAYDGLYRRLSTKEGEKDVYKMARIQERKTRDLNQVKCIKDEMDQLLVKGQDIKQRWQRIQESEVKEALKRMKGGKAMGLDGIPIKAYDKMPRNLMLWALDKHKVPTKYVTLKDMYDKVVTCVRTTDDDTNVFPINI